MFSEGNIGYLDFDIYSRRISFYYKNKEKLGSTFGFILTVIYAIASIILFLIYFIKTLKREELTASDSTIYPNEIPSINLNNDIFYFAFGLKHPNKSSRYIDDTIYFPEVLYIEKIKKDGEIIKTSETNLSVERCNIIKFGKKYRKLFESEELNNSFCINNFNLTLIGSPHYEKMSLIKINIYPCVNSTKNNNSCKPQSVIDNYLTSTYFSILAKDVGLDPFNYKTPIVPTIQDLSTTVDKSVKKEYAIFFGITEINTDIGFFFNRYKKEIYLRYIEDSNNFIIIDNNHYFSGKEIISTEIRLEDKIYCHKRTYTKMSQVFSTIGGYMQVIYTVFSLVVLLSKKISIEKKLLYNLFNFNFKQRKIILCIEYEKKLDYTSSLDKGKKTNFIAYKAKKSILSRPKRYSILNTSQIINTNSNANNNLQTLKKSDTNQNIVPTAMRQMKMNQIPDEGFLQIFKVKKKDNKANIVNQSINRSKADMINLEENNSNIKGLKLKNIYSHKRQIKSNINLNVFNNIKDVAKENDSIINFNIFDYYCFQKMTKKRTEIELFNFGINFFKRQMDIIIFFNIIILTQIILTQKSEKKHNILSQKIELSIE